MSEKSKLIILSAVAVFVIILFGLTFNITNIQNKKFLDNIEAVMNSSEPKVIYLSRPTCHYCQMLGPITDSFKEQYNIDYYEIDTDKISSSMLIKVLKLLGKDLESFGTPYLAVVQNGKVIGEQNGYANENIAFNFLKEYGIINSQASLALNYIDYDKLNSLLESDSREIILIGTSADVTVNYSIKYINELISKNNLTVYYFDVSSIKDTNNYELLLSKINHSSDFTAPYLIITENGQIVAEESVVSLKEYTDFLTTNEYIK